MITHLKTMGFMFLKLIVDFWFGSLCIDIIGLAKKLVCLFATIWSIFNDIN